MTTYSTCSKLGRHITSLSHFNHVFKMAEVADEPNEYLSDDQGLFLSC